MVLIRGTRISDKVRPVNGSHVLIERTNNNDNKVTMMTSSLHVIETCRSDRIEHIAIYVRATV
jgi:hypothetical protein